MRSIFLMLIIGSWLLVGCSDPGALRSSGNDADTAAEDAGVVQDPAADEIADDATGDSPTEPDPNASVDGSGATGGGGTQGSGETGDALIDEPLIDSGPGGDDPIDGNADEPAGSPEQTPGVVVQNFSDFQQFRCVQRSVIVPCLPEGSIYEAVITRQSYNEYLAEISVVERGVIGQDECINTPATYVCVTAAPLEPRLLEADEIDDVQAAFRAVQVDWDSEPGCDPNDTCGVTTFSWDASEVDDSCEAPRLRAEQAQVIWNLLEQLRSGWPATPPQPPQAPASGL